MARVRLTKSHYINGLHLRAGTTIADSSGAALPGDVVWTGLNQQSFSNAMEALDAGATTIKNASRFPAGPMQGFISGAESIQA
jgi:hypothetical protein